MSIKACRRVRIMFELNIFRVRNWLSIQCSCDIIIEIWQRWWWGNANKRAFGMLCNSMHSCQLKLLPFNGFETRFTSEWSKFVFVADCQAPVAFSPFVGSHRPRSFWMHFRRLFRNFWAFSQLNEFQKQFESSNDSLYRTVSLSGQAKLSTRLKLLQQLFGWKLFSSSWEPVTMQFVLLRVRVRWWNRDVSETDHTECQRKCSLFALHNVFCVRAPCLSSITEQHKCLHLQVICSLSQNVTFTAYLNRGYVFQRIN